MARGYDVGHTLDINLQDKFMMTTTTKWLHKVSPILAALMCLSSVSAFAQTAAAPGAWPSKQPIKLVAVFPPGGSVDQVARILSQPLAQQLGQTAIVTTVAAPRAPLVRPLWPQRRRMAIPLPLFSTRMPSTPA